MAPRKKAAEAPRDPQERVRIHHPETGHESVQPLSTAQVLVRSGWQILADGEQPPTANTPKADPEPATDPGSEEE